MATYIRNSTFLPPGPDLPVIEVQLRNAISIPRVLKDEQGRCGRARVDLRRRRQPRPDPRSPQQRLGPRCPVPPLTRTWHKSRRLRGDPPHPRGRFLLLRAARGPGPAGPAGLDRAGRGRDAALRQQLGDPAPWPRILNPHPPPPPALNPAPCPRPPQRHLPPRIPPPQARSACATTPSTRCCASSSWPTPRARSRSRTSLKLS